MAYYSLSHGLLQILIMFWYSVNDLSCRWMLFYLIWLPMHQAQKHLIMKILSTFPILPWDSLSSILPLEDLICARYVHQQWPLFSQYLHDSLSKTVLFNVPSLSFSSFFFLLHVLILSLELKLVQHSFLSFNNLPFSRFGKALCRKRYQRTWGSFTRMWRLSSHLQVGVTQLRSFYFVETSLALSE